MRSRSGILILVGVAIVVAILALVRGNGSQPSVDHQSNSDAADGTSALKAYASALGHPVTTLDSDFTLPHSDAIMFVFTPDQPFTIDEAQALSSWISRGGTLIYANESPDPALDPTLSLHRSDGETSLDALGTLAGLAGVQRVTGSTL
ncbi:MAG TPA: DUF4350 domain-containing protein, partial [Candidatus Dormibacteraeota bacterium]|nr:DUF4350 domain-containing protein [Candidatus Dormibacteraeota bacterium]